MTLSSINLYDSINIKYLVLHNPDIRHTRRDTGHRHWTVIESDMEEKEGKTQRHGEMEGEKVMEEKGGPGGKEVLNY